ncbi:MAG: hypothetical protein R2873_22175 [Caldilineaceae bacterium]
MFAGRGKSGPVVGSDMTIPTSADSEMILGISSASTLIMGLMAAHAVAVDYLTLFESFEIGQW